MDQLLDASAVESHRDDAVARGTARPSSLGMLVSPMSRTVGVLSGPSRSLAYRAQRARGAAWWWDRGRRCRLALCRWMAGATPGCDVRRDTSKMEEIDGRSETLISSLEQMTVLELNSLVKELEERWGVSCGPGRHGCAAPLPAAAAAAAALRRSRPSSTSS